MAKKYLNTQEDFKQWAREKVGNQQAAPGTGAANAISAPGQTQAQQEQGIRDEALERLKSESDPLQDPTSSESKDKWIKGQLFPGYENSDKSVLEQIAANAVQAFPSAMRTLRAQIGGIFGGNGGQQEQKPGTKYTFAGGNKEGPREYTGDEVNDAVKHIDELLSDKNLSWEDKIALQSDRNLLTDYAGGVVQHDAANNESVGAVIGRWGSRKAPETPETTFSFGSSLVADQKRLEALKAEREALISGDWSKGWLAASEMREADFQRLREIGPQINQLEQQVAEKEQDEEARRESARVNAMTDVERFLEGRMSQEEFNQLPESDRNEVMAMYHVYGEDGAQQVLNRLNEEKQVYTAMGLTAQEFSDLRPELREEALRTWREDASHAGFYSMLAREDWSYGSDVFKPGSKSAAADQMELADRDAKKRQEEGDKLAADMEEERLRARYESMTPKDAAEAVRKIDEQLEAIRDPEREQARAWIPLAAAYTPHTRANIEKLTQARDALELFANGETDFNGMAVADLIDQADAVIGDAKTSEAALRKKTAELEAERDKYAPGTPEWKEAQAKVIESERLADEAYRVENPVAYFMNNDLNKWRDDLLLAGLGPIDAMCGQYLRSLQAWGDLGQAAWDLTLGQIKQDPYDKNGNIRVGIPDYARAILGWKGANDNPIYNAIDWMATSLEKSAKKEAEQSVETWTQNLTEAGMKPEDAAYVADLAVNKVGINVASNIGAFLLSKGKRQPMNPSNLGSVLKSPEFLTMWGVSWGRAIREDRAELGEKWNGIDFLFEGLSAGNEAGSELWDVADGNIWYKLGRKVGLGDFGADLVKTNVVESSQELYQDFTGNVFKVGADWVNGREFRIDPALTVENMQKSGTLWSYADACDTVAMTFWNTTGMNVGNFALTHLSPAFSHPYTTSVMATLDGTATEDQKDLAAGVAIAAATIDTVAEQQEQKENGGAPTEQQQHDAFEEGLTGQGAPEDTVPAVNPMKVLDAQRKGRRKLQQPGGAADALRGAAEDAQKGKFLPPEQVQQIVRDEGRSDAQEAEAHEEERRPGPKENQERALGDTEAPQEQDVPVETGSQQKAQGVRDQEPEAEETVLRKPTPAQQTAEMPEAPERLVRPMDASGTGEAMDALVAAAQARTGNEFLSPEEVQAAVAAAQGGMEQTAQAAEETGKAAEEAAGAQAEVDQDEKLDTDVNEPQQGEQESDRLDTDVNKPREETDKLDTDVTEPRAEDQESDRLGTNVTDVPQGEAPEDQNEKLDTETSQAQEQAQTDQNEKLETETGEPPEEQAQESEGAKLETETNQAQEQAQADGDAKLNTEINDVDTSSGAQGTTATVRDEGGSSRTGGGRVSVQTGTTGTGTELTRVRADLEYDDKGVELMSSREKTAQLLNQAQGLSDDLRQAGLHFASWSGGTKMDAETRNQMTIMNDYLKKIGYSAVMDSEITNGKGSYANGSYTYSDVNGHKVIHIAQNSKNPFITVLSHELTHALRTNNPGAYVDLKRAFMKYAQNAGLDVGALVKAKMDLYKRHGVQLNGVDEETGYNAEALEEVIADAMYDVIGDEQAIKSLAAKNPGLIQSIKNWITETLDKIHQLLNGYADKTPQAKMLRDQAGALEELRGIMNDALTETRPIREEKTRVANVGSNGELTEKFQQAIREAEGREEMNKAASELADGILKGQGLEASLGNRQRLYTAAGDFMLSGGTISEAMELFDLKWTAGTAEQNRAFAALGKYVQGLMERNDVEGFQELMEMDEDAAKQVFSLIAVKAVQPSNNSWRPDVFKDYDELKAAFPNLYNIKDDRSEEQKKNDTSIAGTVGTYRKIYQRLQSEGFTGTILDASSGMGLGTKAGREEFGFQVDDIEPFPDPGYKPSKGTDYSKLNEQYDVIISNAVLNVETQDQRDANVVKLGELLKDGGRMYINVRGVGDVANLRKNLDTDWVKEHGMPSADNPYTGRKNIQIGENEYYTGKGTYQKGFTEAELKAYLEDALGDGYTVEIDKKHQTSGSSAVGAVVTKNAGYINGRSDSARPSDINPEYHNPAGMEPHSGAMKYSIMQTVDAMGLYVKTDADGRPYSVIDEQGKEISVITPEMIAKSPIGLEIDAAVANGSISEDVAKAQKQLFAEIGTMICEYKNAAMVWEIAGNTMFSSIKNNSDPQYGTTVDFATICSKTQALINVLSETMVQEGRGLTREEVMKAYNNTAKTGLSVPCPVCYVFSRWMGVLSLLGRMNDYQERYANKAYANMTDAEKRRVQEYIKNIEERFESKRKYVEATDKKPGHMEPIAKTINREKDKFDKQIEDLVKQHSVAMQHNQTDLAEKIRKEIDKLEEEQMDAEAYNWVTQVLCERTKDEEGTWIVKKDKNGNAVIDKNYKPVPKEILFDMRKTGEWAADEALAKSWTFRNTRGAGMGKGILPYAGASIGDTVFDAGKGGGVKGRKKRENNGFLNMNKRQAKAAIKGAIARMKAQNLIGGQRLQSTSDYRPEWGLDYLMTFMEMQNIGAQAQLYTKVIEAVDMFGSVGAFTNLSIMAKGDGYVYVNGVPTLTEDSFSSVTGIDFKQALEMTKKYDTVQMILVGMNDTHIRLAMADDRITMIIPWHSSGSNESVLKDLLEGVGEQLNHADDYSEYERDKPIKDRTKEQENAWDVRTNILTGKYKRGVPAADRQLIESIPQLKDLYNRFYVDESATDTYGVKLSSKQASVIFPFEYWDTNTTIKTADENGKRFVEYCGLFGLEPRFSQFKNDKGYWKLLIDRRMYGLDGTYNKPRAVDVSKFKAEDIPASVSQAKYGDKYRDQENEAIAKTRDDIRARQEAPAYPKYSFMEDTEAEEKESFALDEPVEETRDLVAVHSISVSGLEDVLESGKLVAPSIAVMQEKDLSGNKEFGPISIIFGKDTIDPEANPENRLYGNDAWTARYPEAEPWENMTPERALERMKKQPEKNIESIRNLHNAAAKAYNSIDQMKGDTERLKDVLIGNDLINDEISKEILVYINKDMLRGEKATGRNMKAFLAAAKELSKKENSHLLDGRFSLEAAYMLQNILPQHGWNATRGEIIDVLEYINRLANVKAEYFEAKPMRMVGKEEWAAVVIPTNDGRPAVQKEYDDAAKKAEAAGLTVLRWDARSMFGSDRSRVINAFADEQQIKFSMMDQQGDDAQQGRTAEEAEDEWNLYSDVAGTDENLYNLMNNLIALRTRETENADGRVEHKTGAWKGNIGKLVETIAQQYGNGNRSQVERKVREFMNRMDELAASGAGARTVANEGLRMARVMVREIYGSNEENNLKNDLKDAFGGRTLIIGADALEDVRNGEGGLRGFRNRMAAIGLRVTTKNVDGGFHLESEWEKVAQRFGLDPDTGNVSDQIQELDELVSRSGEYGGMQRALSTEEDRYLDMAAMDLLSSWMLAGSTPVVQRTVTHIDQEHQQQALDRIDQLEAQVSEQADTIDRQAQELADEKAKTRTVLDQLFRRAHELEDLKRSGASRQELDEARKQYAELANKHAETVKANKGLEKKLEKAREKHKELHRELSEARKAEKKAETRAEKLQQRIEKQKERLDKKLEEQKGRFQQQKAKAKQLALRQKQVERIRKTGRKLGRMLASPKQNKYVPQDMVRAAADFVDALLDNTGRKSDKAGAKLQRMIREARSSSDYNVAHSFDETLENQLNQVNELLNDKGALRNMSDGDIALIAGTAEQLMHQINEAGKLQGRQDKADIMEEATDAVKTFNDNPRELNGLKGVLGNYLLNHKNPQRVFRALAGYKDNAVARLGNELSEGQRRKNMLTMRATKCFEELTKGRNAKNFLRFTGEDQSGWTDIGIERLNEQGKKVGTYKMTGEMKASFALHWASEENRKGMSIPGNKDLYQLVMPDENLMKKGKVKEAYQRGSRMTFTSAQARAIIDSMTEYEQKWVAAWRSMEAIIQPAINETSMTLKHYRIATVENYFPIHRDRAYIASDFESIVMDRSLENMGFTKERVNARNPMLLEGLTDVINTQINSVSDYVGYAVPVKNFNKVYNAVMPGYADSVKAALYRTQGKEVAQYLEKLMSDIQGGQHREASFLDKLRGKYAGAVLTLNPAVTIKQAASYPTAASVLGWGALNKALPYFANGKAISTDLIDTYTSAHWERRSEALKDAEGNAKNASAVRKSANKFMNSIQEMDVLTTKVLWKAAEFRVQETTKLRPGSQEDIKNGTDAYYQAVARLYEQAIEETQPEYGVMQRPQILRHDSEIVRSLTMFKTQPLQNLGILMDSFGEMRAAAKAAGAKDATKADQEWFARSKQTFTRAVTSQVVSGVVLAIMNMLGKMLLHKMDPFRDEKGDITAQSAGKQVLSDTLGSWAGMVAGGSEIYELIAGVINGQSPFDIEAAGVSTINDLYQNMYGLLNSATVIGDSSLTASEKWEKIGKQLKKSGLSVAQMFGLPVNNMINLMDGVATNTLEIATGVGGTFQEESALGRIPLIGILLGGAKGRNVSNTKVAPYIAGAMADGDRAEAERLYNEQLRQGKTGQSVSTAIKTQQKAIFRDDIQAAAKAIEAGDVTTYNNLINQMTKGGVNMANAVSWVETERKKIGKAGAAEEGGGNAKETAPIRLTYDEIMESLLPANAKSEQYTTGMLTSLQESGNLAEAQKVYKKLLETREASSIQSSMTSYWKPQLVSAYERGDMTEVKRIKSMLMQFGYKEKTIANWTKKKKTK